MWFFNNTDNIFNMVLITYYYTFWESNDMIDISNKIKHNKFNSYRFSYLIS